MALALIPAASGANLPARACYAAAGAKARVEVQRARQDYAKLSASDISRSADVKRLQLLRQSDQAARDWLMIPAPTCNLNTLNSNLNDPTIKSLVNFLLMTDLWDQASLHAILNRIGWPIISKYGKEADQSAFLVVQHATNDPRLQQSVLAKLKLLVQQKETAGENYALLFDRVQVMSGKLQQFGSQGDCHGETWTADPIADPANVDKRRRDLGMQNLAEYAAKASQLYCRT